MFRQFYFFISLIFFSPTVLENSVNDTEKLLKITEDNKEKLKSESLCQESLISENENENFLLEAHRRKQRIVERSGRL